jgi:hypothetical protein
MNDRPLTLLDSISDLVLGLISIAVGLSVQNIVQKIDIYGAWSGQGLEVLHHFRLLLFTIGFYGLCGIGTLLVLETARDEVQGNEDKWQRYLSTRGLMIAAFLVCAVLYVMFVPTFYSKLAAKHRQVVLVPILLSFYFPLMLLMIPNLSAWLSSMWNDAACVSLWQHIISRIRDRYPYLIRVYVAILFFFFALVVVSDLTM